MHMEKVWGIRGRRAESYPGCWTPGKVHDFNYSLNTYPSHADICIYLMQTEEGTECWPYVIEVK